MAKFQLQIRRNSIPLVFNTFASAQLAHMAMALLHEMMPKHSSCVVVYDEAGKLVPGDQLAKLVQEEICSATTT